MLVVLRGQAQFHGGHAQLLLVSPLSEVHFFPYHESILQLQSLFQLLLSVAKETDRQVLRLQQFVFLNYLKEYY